MHEQIYVNLPVRELDRSIGFFTALGYRFDPRFSDDTATCMVVSAQIHVMLLTHGKFAEFAPAPIADAQTSSQVLIALSCASRAEVDALIDKAVAAGGSTFRPAQDHGFMYQRAYRDLDGHVWELIHMDLNALPSD